MCGGETSFSLLAEIRTLVGCLFSSDLCNPSGVEQAMLLLSPGGKEGLLCSARGTLPAPCCDNCKEEEKEEEEEEEGEGP